MIAFNCLLKAEVKIFLLLFLTLANLLLNFELRIVSRERERGDKREENE